MFTILTEDNETIEVIGTREELDARLIEENCGGYGTPNEFYKANNICFRAPAIEQLTVFQLVDRWL